MGNVVIHLYGSTIVAFYTTFEGLVMQIDQEKRVVFEGEMQFVEKKGSFLRVMA